MLKKEHAITKSTETQRHCIKMPLHAAIEALSNAHPASRLDLGGLLNADRAKPGNANVEVLCMAMRRHARHAAHTRRSQTNQGRERRRTHTTLGPLTTITHTKRSQLLAAIVTAMVFEAGLMLARFSTPTLNHRSATQGVLRQETPRA